MTQQLAGKKTLVTGGTSGLGYATAELFLKEGAQVLITGRTKEKVDAAVAKLGAGAFGAVGDVGVEDSWAGVMAAVKDKLGDKLDVVIANAGNFEMSTLDQATSSVIDKTFNANVKGVIFTVKNAAPLMGKGGSIVVVSSALHMKGGAGLAMYNASKAATRSLTRTYASELGPKGVRINVCSPGMVGSTNILSAAPPGFVEGFAKVYEAATPLGRQGTEAEIAKANLFLASDNSSYMTGSDVQVDGG